MQCEPQALVIGPQGVLDVADMTAKLVRPFAGLDAVGEEVSSEWVIYFPGITSGASFAEKSSTRSGARADGTTS